MNVWQNPELKTEGETLILILISCSSQLCCPSEALSLVGDLPLRFSISTLVSLPLSVDFHPLIHIIVPRNCQDWTLNTLDLAACQLHSDAWKGNPEAPPGRRRAAAALLRSVLGPEGFPPHFRQRQVWFYLFLCNCWWQNSQKGIKVLVYHPAAPGCCWVIVSESDLWLEDKRALVVRNSENLDNYWITFALKKAEFQHLPGRNEAPGGISAGC